MERTLGVKFCMLTWLPHQSFFLLSCIVSLPCRPLTFNMPAISHRFCCIWKFVSGMLVGETSTQRMLCCSKLGQQNFVAIIFNLQNFKLKTKIPSIKQTLPAEKNILVWLHSKLSDCAMRGKSSICDDDVLLWVNTIFALREAGLAASRF